jgi:hypothetical protein
MDFSDLGGVPVGQAKHDIDFSDLGGVPVAPEQSVPESILRGALRNVPLGQQAAAAIAPLNPFSQEKTYSKELEHLNQAAEQGKEQNPISYGVGALAGTLVPLALGQPEGIAANFGLGAGINAAQSLSDENLSKAPSSDAMKQALIAAGIGGTLGAVGKGLQEIAPSENALGASMTGTGLGFNARGAQKLMGGADPEQDIYNLGKWANSAQTPEGKTLAQYIRPGDKLKAINDIHDAAGKTIGDIVDKTGKKISVSTKTLRDELTPILEQVQDINPQSEAKITGIFKRLDKLDSEPGKLDFDAIQKLKSHIGANMADDPAMQQAYGKFAQYANDTVDRYGLLIQDPRMREIYNAAKLDYKNSSQLLPILRKAEGREIAQGPLGNSGLLGMIGGAGALAAGHPVGAAATLAASAVGRPIINTLGRNVALRAVPKAAAIAGGGRGLNKVAQLELSNYLQNKFKGK